MSDKLEKKIDFVILWVDGNDLEWQKKKNEYTPGATADISDSRYREWDNLRYWFRSVEKYAPWVRKIHFVTDGQVPEWLNTENPRIHLVNHSDYMPLEALPVFNSSAIEIALHKIPGLSEEFVYFNDDVFLNAPVSEDFFFHKGKPVDMAGLTRPCVGKNGPDPHNAFSCLLYNDFEILNRFFVRKQILCSHWYQWFKLSYGKTLLRTLMNLGRSQFDGIVLPHLAAAFRRSDFQRVWDVCGNELDAVQYHRFRDSADLNQYIYRFWRLCVGDFYPRRSRGKYIAVSDMESAKTAAEVIRCGREPMICLNDTWEGKDYLEARDCINNAFEARLSKKSKFEK